MRSPHRWRAVTLWTFALALAVLPLWPGAPDIGISIAMLAVGAGSALLHGTGTAAGQMADELAMLLLVLRMLECTDRPRPAVQGTTAAVAAVSNRQQEPPAKPGKSGQIVGARRTSNSPRG